MRKNNLMNATGNNTLVAAMVAIKTYGGYINDHNHDNKITPINRVLGVCELANGNIGMLLSIDCYYSINEVYVDDIGKAHVSTSSISGTVHCNEMINREDIIRFNEGLTFESNKITKVLYVDGSYLDLAKEPKENKENNKEDGQMSKTRLLYLMVHTSNTLPSANSVGIPNTKQWLLFKASILADMSEEEIKDFTDEWVEYCKDKVDNETFKKSGLIDLVLSKKEEEKFISDIKNCNLLANLDLIRYYSELVNKTLKKDEITMKERISNAGGEFKEGFNNGYKTGYEKSYDITTKVLTRIKEAFNNTKMWSMEKFGSIYNGVDLSKYWKCSFVINCIISVFALISITKRGYKEHLRLCGKNIGKLALLAIFVEAVCVTVGKGIPEKDTEK